MLLGFSLLLIIKSEKREREKLKKQFLSKKKPEAEDWGNSIYIAKNEKAYSGENIKSMVR